MFLGRAKVFLKTILHNTDLSVLYMEDNPFRKPIYLLAEYNERNKKALRMAILAD